MPNLKRTDVDEHPIDNQPLKRGRLDDDTKLDIALEGSLMTSEPPQITEPKTASNGETGRKTDKSSASER